MSSIGSKAEVFHGTKERTAGGLTKNDLFLDKDGRIKSKKQSKAGKKNPALKAWRSSMLEAKMKLGIDYDEFKPVKGKLLRETKKIYKTKDV